MSVRLPKGSLVPALFAVAALGTGIAAAHAIAQSLAHPSAHTILTVLYAVLRTAVTVAFAVFTVGRAAPRKPARDPRAFIACALALGAVIAFQPPLSSTPPLLVIAGEALAVAAGAWLVLAVVRLGHCFGVLPEARGLVRDGPYAVIRHPVYAGEIGTCAGLVLAAPRLINGLSFLVLVGAQCVRMRLEERALSAAFPEYERYSQEVPRLIPSPRRVRARVTLSRLPGEADRSGSDITLAPTATD